MKMFDLMMQKKWLLLVLSIVVVAALVIGIVALTGGGEKDPNPTEGTSNVGVTDPTGTTGGNGDNTAPSATAPSGETEPSATNPITPEASEPGPSEPEITEPEVLPTEPEIPETTPTEPSTPSTKPSSPPKEETPEVVEPTETPRPVEYIQGNGYKRVKDFDPATNTGGEGFYMIGNDVFYFYEDEYIFEITPKELTYEIWSSWDTHTQYSYRCFSNLGKDAPIDEKYNFYRITKYENYTCGWENHYCSTESWHETLLESMARGCEYCGGNDCAAFYARDMQGFTYVDFSKCPEYDEHKDPALYCQACGLPLGGASGDVVCNKFKCDATCDYCGKELKAYECHKCIIP